MMFERIRLAKTIARDMDANPDKWRFCANVIERFWTDGTLNIDDERENAIWKPFNLSWGLMSGRIIRRALFRLKTRAARMALIREVQLPSVDAMLAQARLDRELFQEPATFNGQEIVVHGKDEARVLQ